MITLPIDTARFKWQVSRGFEPRVDTTTGAIRMDKRTGHAQYEGQIVGFGPDGAEVFPIVIATEQAPKITAGETVTVTGLVAMPWLTRDTRELRISFRADSVTPVTAGASIKAAS